jgi:hypothetical protein
MVASDREAFRVKHGLGNLFLAFDDQTEGLEACAAVEALIEISAIETLRSSFLLPLQGEAVSAEVFLSSSWIEALIHASSVIATRAEQLFRLGVLARHTLTGTPLCRMVAFTAASTSTQRRADCRAGGPTCRINPRSRRIGITSARHSGHRKVVSSLWQIMGSWSSAFWRT